MKNAKYLIVILFLIVVNIFITTAQDKKPISDKINSASSLESAPGISFDGELIVFMSNSTGKWRLYESHVNSETNEWSLPILIKFEGVELNEMLILKDPSLNHDGNCLYFSANFADTKGNMDIYFSRRENDIWLKPVNVGGQINTEFSERSPSISSDENYIYFVRRNLLNKLNNSSCSKIYYSKKGIKNSWSKSVTLPSPINLDCENYPYIAADNKTLYFSSIREGGLGGYDIYMTKMLAENIWNLPVAVTSVNTEKDELDPSYSTLSKELVFSLAYDERKVKHADIYCVGLSQGTKPDDTFIYKGNIYDSITKNPLHAKLLIRNKDNLKLISEFETDSKTGNYTIVFSKWINYEIEVYKENYSHVFFYVNTKNYKDLEFLSYKNISLFNKTNLILNTFDEEIFEPLQSKVIIKKSDATKIDESLINYAVAGRIEINLSIGDIYTILVEKENYESYLFEFDLSGIVQFGEFEKDVELIPNKIEFEINIADIETDEALDEVEIIITNLEKNETIIKKVRRDEHGKFVVNLRDGDKYEITVNGPKGYAFYNTKVDLSDTEVNKKLDVKLKPLTAKTKLVLNDITYETNSAELNKSSFEELNRVVKLLIDNPEIKIEISAHTDDLGSSNYNQKLSDKRAQSVVAYLVDNNLPVERLIAKGYGETNPMVSNDSDENRAKNRRVELKIID